MRSRVTRVMASILPIFSFLCPSIFDMWHRTDRQTDRETTAINA